MEGDDRTGDMQPGWLRLSPDEKRERLREALLEAGCLPSD